MKFDLFAESNRINQYTSEFYGCKILDPKFHLYQELNNDYTIFENKLFTCYKKKEKAFIFPMLIYDRTYAECLIVKYDNDKWTKMLGSTDFKTYEERYRAFNKEVAPAKPEHKKYSLLGMMVIALLIVNIVSYILQQK